MLSDKKNYWEGSKIWSLKEYFIEKLKSSRSEKIIQN